MNERFVRVFHRQYVILHTSYMYLPLIDVDDTTDTNIKYTLQSYTKSVLMGTYNLINYKRETSEPCTSQTRSPVEC